MSLINYHFHSDKHSTSTKKTYSNETKVSDLILKQGEFNTYITFYNLTSVNIKAEDIQKCSFL